MEIDIEQSATGKPRLPTSNLDGMAPVKPNTFITNQDGKMALKTGGKDEEERIKFLEQQVKMERERRERLEREGVKRIFFV
jgi:hypothetical protein